MSAIEEVSIDTLIERTPGVNGGRACLAGTGISVHQLSVFYNAGATPEEILADYPQADLARVNAGIAYYLLNREVIDAAVEEQAKLYEELAAVSREGRQ